MCVCVVWCACGVVCMCVWYGVCVACMCVCVSVCMCVCVCVWAYTHQCMGKAYLKGQLSSCPSKSYKAVVVREGAFGTTGDEDTTLLTAGGGERGGERREGRLYKTGPVCGATHINPSHTHLGELQ